MSPPIAFINPLGAHRAEVPALDVLVADLPDAHRDRLCSLLHRAGHRVTTAERGDCALDVLRAGLTSVVMVGPRLADMDLATFVAALHALPLDATCFPQVVALRPVTDTAPPDALRAAGVRTFLATPVAASRLLELLATVAKQVDPDRLPPPRQPMFPARTANLDPTMLDELAALGLGATFEHEFIAQCLGDIEVAVGGVVAAGRELNWQHMRDYALATKGVASSVGLVRLASLADSVVKAQDWMLARDAQAVIERLCDALNEAQVLLRERRDAGTQPMARNAAG